MSLSRKINIGFALALLALALVGSVSCRSNFQQGRDAVWVEHTHRVLHTLLDVRTDIQLAQDSERAALGAGHQPGPSFFALGTQARSALDRLGGLTADNPRQRPHVTALRPLFTQEFIPVPGGRDVSLDRAVALDGHIDTILDAMEAEESDLLAQRSRRAEASGRESQRLILACGAVALALGLLAARTIHRDLRRRQEAERALEAAYRELREMNGTLEERIWERTTELAVAHDALTDAYDATIDGWGKALDLKDHETEGHSRRVTEMTMRLAVAMGIEGEDLVHVRRGAVLHDIGKMGVPDSILLKPGPLTEEEWAVMRRHPSLAYDMLSPTEFLRPALTIPLCHHEKWDGTGYPRGLRAESIPLAARIFAVVDVWDALRANRPYRKGWERERVRAHIRLLSGSHFDPGVVKAFIALTDADQGEDTLADTLADESSDTGDGLGLRQAA